MTVLIGYCLVLLAGMFVPWPRVVRWVAWRARRPAPDFADYTGWQRRLDRWRMGRP